MSGQKRVRRRRRRSAGENESPWKATAATSASARPATASAAATVLRLQHDAGNAVASRYVESQLQRKDEEKAGEAKSATWTVTVSDVGTFQATSVGMPARKERDGSGGTPITMTRASDKLSGQLFKLYTEGKAIDRVQIESATLVIDARTVYIASIQVSADEEPVESLELLPQTLQFTPRSD